jgi:hypothetical protein
METRTPVYGDRIGHFAPKRQEQTGRCGLSIPGSLLTPRLASLFPQDDLSKSPNLR